MIDGKDVASDVVRTPQAASKIDVSVDLRGKEISEETPDVIFVYAKILDKNGTLVPSAEEEITFELKANEDAELIGENPVRAKAGIATILLKTKKVTAPIKIEASSPALSAGSLTIK